MNIDLNELLKTNALHGMINESEMQNLIDEMITSQLNEKFINAKEQRIVWKGEGKDKRWKFKKDDGTLVAKTSEEKIKEAYIAYLKSETLEGKKDSMTFGQLYSEWLTYKESQVGTSKGQLSPSTFRRYERDYERYIQNTSFDKMVVSTINAIDIETFLKEMVTSKNLCKKSLANIVGYIKGCMLYARKKGLIDTNPCELIDLAPIRGFCKVIIKNDKERVLSDDEMSRLITTLHQKERENESYIQNYAIELATMCGLRVGELVALKWECVGDDYLKIDFSEHRLDYKDKSCEYIIGEPKCGKHRQFPMTNEMKDLFTRIKEMQTKYHIESEYVFANEYGRINSHTISCAMTRRCNDAKIPTRSIHAIRRTISSQLRAMLPIASVACLMGHIEETNEKHYNYDIINDEVKIEHLTNMYNAFKKVA